jgi:hypothetical protein
VPGQNPKQSEILQIIREQFAFLKIDKGFTKPILHTSLDHFIDRNDALKVGIEPDFFMHGTTNVVVEKLAPSERSTRASWNLLGLLTRRLHIQDERIGQLINAKGQHQREKGAFPRVDLDQDSPFIIEQIERYHSLLADYIDVILKQSLDFLFPTDLEFLPMYTARTQIEQYAIDHLSFLSQKGFADHPVIENNGRGTYHTWLNQRLGVRMSFDYRDAAINLGFVLLKQDEPIYRKTAKKYRLELLNIERQIWFRRDLASRLHLPIEQFNVNPTAPQFYYWSTECDYAFAISYIEAYRDSLGDIINAILEMPLETLFAG